MKTGADGVDLLACSHGVFLREQCADCEREADRVILAPSKVVRFEVRGVAQTQGSMRAFMPKGARFPVVTHGSPKTTQWRNLVALEAKRVAPPEPWTGPVLVDVTIRLQRPNGHFGKRGVKPSAPALPAGARNDVDKYLRGILDALTGVFWRDDGQVVEATVRKEYGPAGAVVELRELVTA